AELLQPTAEAHRVRLVYRELEKIDALVARCPWRREQRRYDGCGRRRSVQSLAGLFFQVPQRAQAIGGDATRRCGTEAVVEHLQRQWAAVASLQHRREKAGQIEL